MNRSYITDEEYEQAEHSIYNDIPTHVLYPVSESLDEFREDVAREICLPGEKYVQFTTVEGNTYMAYTSYGRLINTKSIRVLKPSITRLNVLHYIGKNRIRSTDMFEANGWKHDIKEIVKKYREMKWTTVYDYYLEQQG